MTVFSGVYLYKPTLGGALHSEELAVNLLNYLHTAWSLIWWLGKV